MKTPAFEALSPAARDFFLQQMKDAVSIEVSMNDTPRQEKYRSLVCDRIFAQAFMRDGAGLIEYFRKYDLSGDETVDEGLDLAELERLGYRRPRPRHVGVRHPPSSQMLFRPEEVQGRSEGG